MEHGELRIWQNVTSFNAELKGKQRVPYLFLSHTAACGYFAHDSLSIARFFGTRPSFSRQAFCIEHVVTSKQSLSRDSSAASSTNLEQQRPTRIPPIQNFPRLLANLLSPNSRNQQQLYKFQQTPAKKSERETDQSTGRSPLKKPMQVTPIVTPTNEIRNWRRSGEKQFNIK